MEINPCPFCGNAEVNFHHLGEGAKHGYVMCPNCQTFGPSGDTETEAIEKWNARPNHVEPPAMRGSTYVIDEITYMVTFQYNGPVTYCAIAWHDKRGRLHGYQGAAYCNPADNYDQNTGERLAMKRACGIGQDWYAAQQMRELYDAWRRDQWEAHMKAEVAPYMPQTNHPAPDAHLEEQYETQVSGADTELPY